MFESIKSKISKKLFHAVKNGVKIFSYKEENGKLLIFPYAKYFNNTASFYIEKNELEDIINKVILE